MEVSTSPIPYLDSAQILENGSMFYSILFANEEHKQYWYVTVYGESQAILSVNGKIVRFATKEEAQEFCMLTFPDSKMI